MVGWDVVEDGVDDGEVVQVEPVGEPAGLPGLLRRGHGPDECGGLAEGVEPVFDEVVAGGPPPAGLVDDEVGQWIPLLEGGGESRPGRGWRAVPPGPSRRPG